MPVFLKKRGAGLEERMDDPGCDPEMLNATYAQFRLVNRVVSGWGRVYTRYLRPVMQSESTTLLDVGFGGGDIPIALARWAARDGLGLEITAIDPDPRALAYAQSQPCPPSVSFCAATTETLVREGRRFDIVISNHLLHHLSPAGLQQLCRDSERLGRRLVVHNDIARGDLAYLGFALTRPLFRHSFTTEDGLTSIRRSYTPTELRRALLPGWRVERLAPYRNLLVYRP